MSRASTALSRVVSSPLSRTLARSPEDFSKLEDARGILVDAAPKAAAVLAGMDADKDQISAAKDILDRVGLSASSASPSPSDESAMSEIAYGAFRALLSHFGLSVPDASPAIPAVSEVVPEREAPSSIPSKAKPKAKSKKKTKDDDEFLVALEETDV